MFRRWLWALVLPLLLVAPAKALRVCADPDYLPYSNRAGAGFENKIAEAVAAALGEKAEYTWASYRGHGGFPQFLSTTLDANKCEVVMSLPYGSREELTTRPYYTSSYVFVFRSDKKLAITSLNSPALKRLKIGFERDTPAEEGLKMRGLIPGTPPGGIVSFDIADDSSVSPATMLEAVQNGRIDVLITWQPVISGFLRSSAGLELVAVPNERVLGPPEQYAFPMSLAVREGNDALKKRLDAVIESHQAELTSILTAQGVFVYGQGSK